ncbi:hypothetical protein AMS69_18910 [Haloarcula rubripromontorii]|nr:winged helix-turn-helix domain-containing protein [Haloarcula rubripromontorii]KOX91444.1 hypothetical protein AMS69_18910 [Haloarcula rubripromontorii]
MKTEANQSPNRDPDSEEAYAEDTPLTWAFGDTPKVKIIAALLSEAERDINISDISRLSGVSRSAIYEHLDDLVELGVVAQTREMGGSTLYQINTENEAVEKIAELESVFLSQWCNDEIKITTE